MENLNICIDIDGTITDAYYWLNLCNKYFNTNITEGEVTEYSIYKVLNIPEEDYSKFYEKYKFKLHTEEKLRPEARNIIAKLNLLNNIHFVTARDRDLTILTYSYLRKHSIPYDTLSVLGNTHKVATARALDCDVFIEDSYNNAIELSNAGFKVLLMDTNYNRKPLNDTIVRVFNWDQIYTIISRSILEIQAI